MLRLPTVLFSELVSDCDTGSAVATALLTCSSVLVSFVCAERPRLRLRPELRPSCRRLPLFSLRAVSLRSVSLRRVSWRLPSVSVRVRLSLRPRPRPRPPRRLSLRDRLLVFRFERSLGLASSCSTFSSVLVLANLPNSRFSKPGFFSWVPALAATGAGAEGAMLTAETAACSTGRLVVVIVSMVLASSSAAISKLVLPFTSASSLRNRWTTNRGDSKLACGTMIRSSL